MNDAYRNLLKAMDGCDWMSVSQIRRIYPDTSGMLRQRLGSLLKEGYVEKRIRGTMVQPRNEWRRTSKPIPDSARTKKEKALECLDSEWATTVEVSRTAGISRNYTLQALKDLESEGKVLRRQNVQGRRVNEWRLPE